MTPAEVSRRWFAIGRIVLAAAIWGAAYPLTKGALNQVPPLLLGAGRFLLAGLVLMAWTRSLPLAGVAPPDRPRMVGLAFWGTFVLVVGMNYGLGWAPAGIASILSGTPPLFTVFLAAAWLGDPLERRHFLALGVALAGMVLLAREGLDFSPGWRTLAGCVLVLVPQIAWAVYSVLGKAILATYDWRIVCRDTFALGAAMLLPLAGLEVAWLGPGVWDARSLGILLYLGLLNSVGTYGLWNSALQAIPVSTASFILYLQPITGAILAVILFGESFGARGLLGSLLVFGALSLVLAPTRPAVPAPAPSPVAEA